MDSVRLGIVGLGNMGKAHLSNIRAGKVPGLRVTALCESTGTLPELQDGESPFSNVSEMIKSGKIDAILICTPHFSHTTIGIEALQNLSPRTPTRAKSSPPCSTCAPMPASRR